MVVNEIKIRELLFRQRKTQTQLSRDIHASRNTISAICNGKSCSEKTARRIADALGVTMQEITQQ